MRPEEMIMIATAAFLGSLKVSWTISIGVSYRLTIEDAAAEKIARKKMIEKM